MLRKREAVADKGAKTASERRLGRKKHSPPRVHAGGVVGGWWVAGGLVAGWLGGWLAGWLVAGGCWLAG